MDFKDIKIENPHDFAIKIFPFKDKKIIERIKDWKYFENSFDLQDDENSPPYLCLYMKGNAKQIPIIAKEILHSIFELEVNDEIEYGIKLYE
ncbi:hypothetical protein JCM19298_2708 [Nonlabens ulvanivorans]|nr:hypothetical protein JCM19298_2708 [Nonlabens ulvanivorans]